MQNRLSTEAFDKKDQPAAQTIQTSSHKKFKRDFFISELPTETKANIKYSYLAEEYWEWKADQVNTNKFSKKRNIRYGRTVNNTLLYEPMLMSVAASYQCCGSNQESSTCVRCADCLCTCLHVVECLPLEILAKTFCCLAASIGCCLDCLDPSLDTQQQNNIADKALLEPALTDYENNFAAFLHHFNQNRKFRDAFVSIEDVQANNFNKLVYILLHGRNPQNDSPMKDADTVSLHDRQQALVYLHERGVSFIQLNYSEANNPNHVFNHVLNLVLSRQPDSHHMLGFILELCQAKTFILEGGKTALAKVIDQAFSAIDYTKIQDGRPLLPREKMCEKILLLAKFGIRLNCFNNYYQKLQVTDLLTIQTAYPKTIPMRIGAIATHPHNKAINTFGIFHRPIAHLIADYYGDGPHEYDINEASLDETSLCF